MLASLTVVASVSSLAACSVEVGEAESAHTEVSGDVESQSGTTTSLDIACKTPYGTEPELVRITRTDHEYSVRFDNVEVEGLACSESTEYSGTEYIVRCTEDLASPSKDAPELIHVSTADGIFPDGTLILEPKGEKIGLICHNLLEDE
jgi:hypothetical protein